MAILPAVPSLLLSATMNKNSEDQSEDPFDARYHSEAVDALFVQADHLRACLRDAGVPAGLIAHAEQVVQLAFDAGVKAGASSSRQSARHAGDKPLTEVRKFATEEAYRWIQEWEQEFGGNGRAAPTMSDCINGYKVNRAIKKHGIRSAVIEMASKLESNRARAFAQNATPRTIAGWLKDSPQIVSFFPRVKTK